MCELTLSNLNDAVKNAGVTMMSALINSDRNPHGFGFYNGTDVWKTALKPADLGGLGFFIRDEIKTTIPIMSHVRLASKGIELKEENNHPFETEDFIGAHNGTLYLKEEEPYSSTWDNSSRGSDSQRFFEMLQAEYTSNGKKFVEAIKTVMEKHKGKFAFLIYEKPTQTFYIVRGKSADLHIVDVFLTKKKSQQFLGFIVNTDKYDLEKLTLFLPHIWGLMGVPGIFDFSEIAALKPETIYAVKGNRIKEITEIKENSVYVPSSNSNNYGFHRPHDRWGDNTETSNTKDKGTFTVDSMNRAIVEFQNQHFLTPADMDLIFYRTLGVVAIDVDEEGMEYFVRYVIKDLHRNKAIRKRIKAAQIRTIPSYFYSDKKFGLEFPWMVNSEKQIIAALDEFERENIIRNSLEKNTQLALPEKT